jgi:hypothetical protein
MIDLKSFSSQHDMQPRAAESRPFLGQIFEPDPDLSFFFSFRPVSVCIGRPAQIYQPASMPDTQPKAPDREISGLLFCPGL